MTPGWEDALAEHRGDSRRARALVMAAAAVLVTAAAMAYGAKKRPRVANRRGKARAGLWFAQIDERYIFG